MPLAMLQNQEPARKRSKLVLPEPQISDMEMQQVVKLGRASEIAKEVAAESGIKTTDELLADYSIAPTAAASPRTPAPVTDRVMQEAQNMMALTHVDTPLKGGLNTPLHDSDFSGALPKSAAIATPNTVLATPFRSSHGEVAGNPGGVVTPVSNALVPVGKTPLQNAGSTTPALVRDKLNINAEESLGVTETPAAYKNCQKQLKQSLKDGLASLPASRNDYEIVVPDQEDMPNDKQSNDSLVEDQADVDAKLMAEKRAEGERELRKRSRAIQRSLPRPLEVNTKIPRPPSEKHCGKIEKKTKNINGRLSNPITGIDKAIAGHMRTD